MKDMEIKLAENEKRKIPNKMKIMKMKTKHFHGPKNERTAFPPSQFLPFWQTRTSAHFCAIRGGRALQAIPKLPVGGFHFLAQKNVSFSFFTISHFRGESFIFFMFFHFIFHCFHFLHFPFSISPRKSLNLRDLI